MNVIERNDRRIYLRAAIEAVELAALVRKYGTEGRALGALREAYHRAVLELVSEAGINGSDGTGPCVS